MRRSHLNDGESQGLAKVRVSVEIPKEGGKSELIKEAMGYTIRREVVGLWIFKELVSGGGKAEWEGKIVGLTY